MWLGINLEAWLTIVAILISPLLAFEVQRRRDNRREARQAKLLIFNQLLATLKAPLAPVHVDAINRVHVVFYHDKLVIDSWRLYVSHLNQRANSVQQWNDKKFDLLVDLIYQIGCVLCYGRIDKATIRDNTYLPQGYADSEEEFRRIRAAVLEVLQGQRPVATTVLGPIRIAEPLPQPQAIDPHPPSRTSLPLPPSA